MPCLYNLRSTVSAERAKHAVWKTLAIKSPILRVFSLPSPQRESRLVHPSTSKNSCVRFYLWPQYCGANLSSAADSEYCQTAASQKAWSGGEILNATKVGHKYQHPVVGMQQLKLIACNALNAGLHGPARHAGADYCCTTRCLPHPSASHWHGRKTNLYRIATIACIFDVFLFLLFYGTLNARLECNA